MRNGARDHSADRYAHEQHHDAADGQDNAESHLGGVLGLDDGRRGRDGAGLDVHRLLDGHIGGRSDGSQSLDGGGRLVAGIDLIQQLGAEAGIVGFLGQFQQSTARA